MLQKISLNKFFEYTPLFPGIDRRRKKSFITLNSGGPEYIGDVRRPGKPEQLRLQDLRLRVRSWRHGQQHLRKEVRRKSPDQVSIFYKKNKI